MVNRDAFSACHPLVNFLFFGLVLGFSMFLSHPLCLGISLGCAAAYSIYLNGSRAVRFCLLTLLPMFLAAALLNPAFSHAGLTVLTYLPGGNPLTLESILYGLSAAAMLVAVILWFSCYNAVMTSDKFVYLFGRLIPALSLLLAMTLRFVPKFKAQIKVIANAQCCIGRNASMGSLLQRLKNGLTILSIMVTWALENAIETADSMKGRGYGLPGRTAFSLYRFDRRDKRALTFLMGCGLYILAGAALGGLKWRYYPSVKGVGFEGFSLSLYLIYLALCIMPVTLNITEDRKWISIRSEA